MAAHYHQEVYAIKRKMLFLGFSSLSVALPFATAEVLVRLLNISTVVRLLCGDNQIPDRAFLWLLPL